MKIISFKQSTFNIVHWSLSMKIILLDYQNYFDAQTFLQFCKKILTFQQPIWAYILHNYFDSPTELFSDLYLVKFLDTLANPFFP